MKRFVLPLCALSLVAAGLPGLPGNHSETVDGLYRAAHESDVAYERLRWLCEVIGHRLSGSAQLEEAFDWAAAQMREDGLQVTEQPVMVPHWVRGEESLTLLAPTERPLQVLGLGMTVAGDVEAEVVVVSSFEELEQTDVSGRIVLYDVPFTTYGETVQYRGAGPRRAAAKGAVGVLVRSVTPVSLSTPHTGATRAPEEGVPAIPAAAVTVEDAAWMHGLQDRGIPIRVHLHLSGELLDESPSRNLIGDLPGRELPDEAVLLGCHYDSWDVGQGAQDDGAGCMIAWEAVRLISLLPEPPRRTVRVVLYTNEENGLRGGVAYAEELFDSPRIVAAIESDTGNGRADGFRVDLRMEDPTRSQSAVWELGAALEAIGGGHMSPGYSGADVGPLAARGVPSFGMNHDTTTYWPIHHTWADTFDKIVLEDLQHNAGVMAAMAWMLAEREEPLVVETRRRRR